MPPDPARERAAAVVGGVTVDLSAVAGIAIAQALVDDSFYLLDCNSRWETLAAEPHSGPASARQAAQHAFGAAIPWQAYRELTPEERREAETTRAFLRELAADPDNA